MASNSASASGSLRGSLSLKTEAPTVACSGCACSHIIRSKESRPSTSVWFDPSHSVLYRMSELRRMVGPWAPVSARGAMVLWEAA